MALKTGDIVIYEGVPQLVLRVNDCRAVIRPVRRRPILIQTRRGEPRRFLARGRESSISPTSELPRHGN